MLLFKSPIINLFTKDLGLVMAQESVQRRVLSQSPTTWSYPQNSFVLEDNNLFLKLSSNCHSHTMAQVHTYTRSKLNIFKTPWEGRLEIIKAPAEGRGQTNGRRCRDVEDRFQTYSYHNNGGWPRQPEWVENINKDTQTEEDRKS